MGPFYEFHNKVAHKWRPLAIELERSFPSSGASPLQIEPSSKARDELQDSLKYSLDSLCNGCRGFLEEVLDVPKGRIHCTIKLLAPPVTNLGGEQNDLRPLELLTVSRSDNLLDRPPEWGVRHRVDKNTVFAAMCGQYDGETHWRPCSYFSCNDLTIHGDKFKCDRNNWGRYYKSVLAAPLRYEPEKDSPWIIWGFVTFDMPTTNEFTGVSDVFTTEFDEYHQRMLWPTATQCVGIIADTLSVLLKPLMEEPSLDE